MTTSQRRPNVQLPGNPAVVYILIPARAIPHTQNNNKEHMCTLTNGNRYILNQKLMAIDVHSEHQFKFSRGQDLKFLLRRK